MKKIPIEDMDYVELYAEKLREDNSLFEQQKRFIEAQIIASRMLFFRMFGRKFKENARKYLREVGII